MSKLTIGTNGFIYPTSNRKGSDLWTRLVNDPELSQILDYRASGRGWGAMTKAYPFEDLEKFYHSIDIYVSTSEVEGIGYGILEALASGIPVIMPVGVGIYDEIHNAENIYRYKKSDYNDMVLAIKKCIEDLSDNHLNRESLRSTTAKFTLDAWCNDHIKAFEDLLYGSSKTEKNSHSSDLHDKMGVYYVAYGDNARECFKHALTSVRKYLNDIPVCLVSDTPIEIDLDYQFIEYPDNDIGARGNKTLIYELAPKEWEYILYLDADTEVISKDVMLYFKLLQDGFDTVFCINPTSYALVSDMLRPDNQDEIIDLIERLGTGELLQLNGGVFSFRRNETTEKLFNGWHTEWLKYGKRDQAALDRVLYSLKVKLYVLGVEFNTVTRYYPAERSVALLHYPLTARRFRGRIEGRLDSDETWAMYHDGRIPENK